MIDARGKKPHDSQIAYCHKCKKSVNVTILEQTPIIYGNVYSFIGRCLECMDVVIDFYSDRYFWEEFRKFLTEKYYDMNKQYSERFAMDMSQTGWHLRTALKIPLYSIGMIKYDDMNNKLNDMEELQNMNDKKRKEIIDNYKHVLNYLELFIKELRENKAIETSYERSKIYNAPDCEINDDWRSYDYYKESEPIGMITEYITCSRSGGFISPFLLILKEKIIEMDDKCNDLIINNENLNQENEKLRKEVSWLNREYRQPAIEMQYKKEQLNMIKSKKSR